MLAKLNFPREALVVSGIYQTLFNAGIKIAGYGYCGPGGAPVTGLRGAYCNVRVIPPTLLVAVSEFFTAFPKHSSSPVCA